VTISGTSSDRREIDGSDWRSVKDFLMALRAAIGAPDEHGSNVNAFIDSMIWVGINQTEPPYEIRISGTERGPKGRALGSPGRHGSSRYRAQSEASMPPMRDRHPSVAQGAKGVQSCPVLLREMQQTGSQGRRLVLSVQTFKKCPFYAGLFARGKHTPNQLLNVKETDG
jgi:Barstar (barnase inhibitor)